MRRGSHTTVSSLISRCHLRFYVPSGSMWARQATFNFYFQLMVKLRGHHLWPLELYCCFTTYLTGDECKLFQVFWYFCTYVHFRYTADPAVTEKSQVLSHYSTPYQIASAVHTYYCFQMKKKKKLLLRAAVRPHWDSPTHFSFFFFFLSPPLPIFS